MPKYSKQTISFVILFCLALFSIFFCLTLWANLGYNPDYSEVYNSTPEQANQNDQQITPILKAPAVDTSSWKTYTDSKFKFSFKYPSDWKVLPAVVKNGYNIIQVDPGKKYYNIKIYVSSKDYYVLAGLPTTIETIGGEPALNVHNALYGIKANNLYYTFDVGLSMSLLPNFDALVHSAQFTQ